ncbi:MAG: hypothetical protein ACXWHZ_03725 [Usitatibacter sp.]
MDFDFSDHGSICILTPLTPAAREWRAEYLPSDAQTWGRGGVVIERRYVSDILDGIDIAGLSVGR